MKLQRNLRDFRTSDKDVISSNKLCLISWINQNNNKNSKNKIVLIKFSIATQQITKKIKKHLKKAKNSNRFRTK